MWWKRLLHIMSGGNERAVYDFIAFGYWGVDKKYLKKEGKLEYVWEG